MQILKDDETIEVVARQLEFFQTVGGVEAKRLNSNTYSYPYIPGTNAVDVGAVIDYLNDFVWQRTAIDQFDKYTPEGSQANYRNYIAGLCDRLNFTEVLPVLDEFAEEFSCGSRIGEGILVHGDATMENFIQTKSGIVAIDPGLPRGFCNRQNDIGKLLQSVVTQWELVRHNSVVHFRNVEAIPYCRLSVASLLSHWIRIVKNIRRHTPPVERYAREVVVPMLTDALTNSELPSLKTLCDWFNASVQNYVVYA